MADNNTITPTPENPIPDVDEIKPGIPDPAWNDEGGGGGTGGGALVCHINEDTQSLDKTWNEIKSAASTSVVIALGGDEYETNIWILKSVFIDTDDDDNTIYVASFSNLEGYVAPYVTSSADGYPTASIG